jgi:hypothetical protein
MDHEPMHLLQAL